MICPFDYKPCMDDLCHGGGCLRSPHGNEPMLVRCYRCGNLMEEGLCDVCEDCEEPEAWDDRDFDDANQPDDLDYF